MTHIGPAVLNGCVSTFLSIILLADSNSSIFEVFFKVTKCCHEVMTMNIGDNRCAVLISEA